MERDPRTLARYWANISIGYVGNSGRDLSRIPQDETPHIRGLRLSSRWRPMAPQPDQMSRGCRSVHAGLSATASSVSGPLMRNANDSAARESAARGLRQSVCLRERGSSDYDPPSRTFNSQASSCLRRRKKRKKAGWLAAPIATGSLTLLAICPHGLTFRSRASAAPPQHIRRTNTPRAVRPISVVAPRFVPTIWDKPIGSTTKRSWRTDGSTWPP